MYLFNAALSTAYLRLYGCRKYVYKNIKAAVTQRRGSTTR